jgi:hypothetical protein
MTWKPASVKKMPGHIFVRRSSQLYWKISQVSVLKLDPFVTSFLRTNQLSHLTPTPYRFSNVREKLLYVNGRREVYEVNLSCGWLEDVAFDPVMKYCGVPVLFRKLHKLEWLFV